MAGGKARRSNYKGLFVARKRNKLKDNKNYLADLCDTLLLRNLITDVNCKKLSSTTLIDIFMTKKTGYLPNVAAIKPSLNDCNKMILKFFNA